MQSANRPMSILVVCKSEAESTILRYGIQDALEGDCKLIDSLTDLKKANELFIETHHDIVIVHGFASTQSESFVMRVRRADGRRHTGIIVMAPTDDGFDKVVVDNYNAGADEVVPHNLSLAILKSKMIMVFNYKITTDLLRAANHKLKAMIVTDELTGCANMRGFTAKFALSMAACAKGERGVAVVMMDLDRFKSVNDNYNHLVGSHVIKTIGQFLMNSGALKKGDLAARYGGDEFVLCLHGDDVHELHDRMKKLCNNISKEQIAYDHVTLTVTASLGLAFVPKGFQGVSSDLVKAADAMLYRSKELGRNRVSAMLLKYPIDFNHIGKMHLIEDALDKDGATSPLKGVS